MSVVTATCSNGHHWRAHKSVHLRTTFKGPAVIRAVDPKRCPHCQGEWIAVYEKNERRNGS